MSRFARIFLVLFLPALLLTGAATAGAKAPAARQLAGPIVKRLYPVADTYVYEGDPTRNYGTETLMAAGYAGGEYQSFVRFDLSPIPANAIVLTGTLDGEGEHHFTAWVADSPPDSFQLRIWEETDQGDLLVSENDPQQPGGRNIIVR